MKHISKHCTEFLSILANYTTAVISVPHEKKWKMREQWNEAECEEPWNENKDKDMRQLATTEQ